MGTSPRLFCLFLYTLFVATFLLVSALSNCNRLGDFSADPVLCMTRFLTEKSSILSITPVFSDYGQGYSKVGHWTSLSGGTIRQYFWNPLCSSQCPIFPPFATHCFTY